MDDYGLEIFDQTPTYAELRFHDGEKSRERGLDRTVVDELIASVESDYRHQSAAASVFGSAPMLDLGRRLYEFIDGNERWLANSLSNPRGSALRITAEERLRHLPWELMASDNAHLSVNPTVPFTPVRAVSTRVSLQPATDPANRPLRVLFMATSPEGVDPELAYETEEAEILQATTEVQAELVVEESGTLEGLRFIIDSYGSGYFDVLHLTGHATIHEDQPAFLIEDELGGPALASPNDIARAIGQNWPRLVFVSGCLTGNAPLEGTVPSMSESLIGAGATAVLGWALPVGDRAATAFASALYKHLASGHGLGESVAEARHHLYVERSRYWHLLRLYADASPLLPMVTERLHPGRESLTTHRASAQFLDPATEQIRVASREEFVGRRRVIQRCLRTLQRPLTEPDAHEGLVLQGMGGLGKSTLASRLMERMPTHQQAVWVGRVDEDKFASLTSKVDFDRYEDRGEVDRILADQSQSLEARLQFLFARGPLRSLRCLFVFDDFEYGNLDKRDGEYVLSPEMSEILPALLKALRSTNNPSRVIITSRYGFPEPAGCRIRTEGLETLNPNEQTKKLAGLTNLGPTSKLDETVQDRAIVAAAGIPRLLEWLDKIVVAEALDVDGLLAAIEGEADRFRKETIVAHRLLDAQPQALVIMLAKVNLVELPIPTETVLAIHEHPEAEHHIRRAAALGLLEEGTDPATNERRYLVSNVLRPLLDDHLTEEQRIEACAAAARSLYEIWVEPSISTEEGADDDETPGE